jgi:hypothetical protein
MDNPFDTIQEIPNHFINQKKIVMAPICDDFQRSRLTTSNLIELTGFRLVTTKSLLFFKFVKYCEIKFFERSRLAMKT